MHSPGDENLRKESCGCRLPDLEVSVRHQRLISAAQRVQQARPFSPRASAKASIDLGRRDLQRWAIKEQGPHELGDLLHLQRDVPVFRQVLVFCPSTTEIPPPGLLELLAHFFDKCQVLLLVPRRSIEGPISVYPRLLAPFPLDRWGYGCWMEVWTDTAQWLKRR